MARTTLLGLRIRELRQGRRMTQAELARRAGISASYLNLIEHNRRRIGGKLLLRLAEALSVDPSELTEAGDEAVIADLASVAARRAAGQEMAPESPADLATRFPGWARLILALARRTETLQEAVMALTDRLGHDPALASAVHDMLTAATAIRSTAGILADPEGLDETWRARFTRNLVEDSDRLTEAARRLTGHLEVNEAARTEAGPSPAGAARELVAQIGPEVDAMTEDGALDEVLAELPQDLPSSVRFEVARLARQRMRDARRLPDDRLLPVLGRVGLDPEALCAELEAPATVVMRRLAWLADAAETGPFGVLAADAAGAVTTLRPLDGFHVPANGVTCPLWPLFAALSAPGQALRATLVGPDEVMARFVVHAASEAVTPARFGRPALFQSVMLVAPLRGEGVEPVIEAGVSCPTCPRRGCASRREPFLLGEGL